MDFHLNPYAKEGAGLDLNRSDNSLALIRIVIGVWFLHSGLAHVTLTPSLWSTAHWDQEMERLITLYSQDHPYPWFQSFMVDTLLPNSARFAAYSSIGELVLGLALTLGLLTPLVSVAGMGYAALFGLMKIHAGLGPQGLYMILFFSMLGFAMAKAGRHWGGDMILAKFWEKSPVW
ncbi:MAG: DoxX family membrane protein [Deltaproteobacteria bacterium]|nr:DoxX family membrane protein [Deltaproteobacteria bacterium]